jgi:hypothetical protein
VAVAVASLAGLNMSITVFEFFRDYAQWFNYPALILVMLLCFRNRNFLTFFVFLDFIIIGAIHDHMVAVGTYGPNIVEYILLSGIKDIIVLYFLNKMSANATIKASYLIIGTFLIVTWFLMNYYRDLAVYFYRFRGFFIVATMLLQVYGLTQNGGIKRNNKRTGNTSKHNATNSLYGAEWGGANGGIYTARTNSDAESYKGFRR